MTKPKHELLLTELQYCHILDKNTGKVYLEEGTVKRELKKNEEIYGTIQKKIVLKEGQYVIVLNPYNKEAKMNAYGEREVRIGACVIALYPNEKIDKTVWKLTVQEVSHTLKDQPPIVAYAAHNIESFAMGTGSAFYGFHPTGSIIYDQGQKTSIQSDTTEKEQFNGIRDEIILKKCSGLLLMAMKDFTDEDGVEHKAGGIWTIKGERKYIPHKYVMIRRYLEPITLGQNEGVYIINTDTGEVRLERGAKVIMMEYNEEYYTKEYTKEERNALDIRNINKSRAVPIRLEDGEFAKISGVTGDTYITGSGTYMLQPLDHIKVLNGDQWKIKMIPFYVPDTIRGFTIDKINININVEYKCKFDNTAELKTFFNVSNYIDYIKKELAIKIRNIISGFTFEELSSNTKQTITLAIFEPLSPDRFVFLENNLHILCVDISQFTPIDTTISESISNTIKTTIDQNIKIKLAKELTIAEADNRKIRSNMEKLISIEIIELQMEFVKKYGKNYLSVKALDQMKDAQKIYIPTDIKYLNPEKE